MPPAIATNLLVEMIQKELDENKTLTNEQRTDLMKAVAKAVASENRVKSQKSKERQKLAKQGVKRGPGRPSKEKPFTPTPTAGLAGFLEATGGKEKVDAESDKTSGCSHECGEAPRSEQGGGSE